MPHAKFEPSMAAAIDWMTERLPDEAFQKFISEMEEAVQPVLMKYGLDGELMQAFDTANAFTFKRTIKRD